MKLRHNFPENAFIFNVYLVCTVKEDSVNVLGKKMEVFAISSLTTIFRTFGPRITFFKHAFKIKNKFNLSKQCSFV